MNRVVTYRILDGRSRDRARLLTILEMCRQLYNAVIQQRRDAWKKAHKSLTYFDQCRELTELRQMDEEWKAVNCEMVRHTVLKRGDETFKGFYRRANAKKEKVGYPRYKGRDRFDTLIFGPTGWKLEGNRLTLQGIGWFRVRGKDREGRPIGLRLVRMADRWYAQVVLDIGDAPKARESRNGVGIDVGLTTFATMSDGSEIGHPKFLRASLDELAKANQRLSRRKRGSNRRREAKRLLARVHLRIANRRRDFLHKATRRLVDRYDGFAVEDLDIKAMAQGIRFLRRGIMDSGWSRFFTMLQYKAEGAGMQMVRVNPRGTTQRCSGCGSIVRKGLGDRWHSCGACGLEMGRDLNAAKNVWERGSVGVGGFEPRSLVEGST